MGIIFFASVIWIYTNYYKGNIDFMSLVAEVNVDANSMYRI